MSFVALDHSALARPLTNKLIQSTPGVASEGVVPSGLTLLRPSPTLVAPAAAE
jgi:hypothetical protein